MKRSSARDALNAVGDLAFELETGLRKPEPGPAPVEEESPRAEPEETITFSQAAEYAAIHWERQMVEQWREQGRMTEDGRLRISSATLPPYTLGDLMRIVPHLTVLDRLAVLIDLDGVVEENFMANPEHERIRVAVEDIVDIRLIRKLQSDDTKMLLRDLFRAELAAVFGELHEQVRDPEGPRTAGRGGHARKQLKCSKCHTPGHRAPTCPGPADPPAEAAS